MDEKSRKPDPDPEAIRLLESAFAEFARYGAVSSIRCDECNGVIEITKIGEDAHEVNCSCGKFKDTLKGL